MELTDLPMFGLVKRRLSWLNQRQEVVAQNIANADTPKYASRDIKAFDFQAELRRERHQGNPGTVPVNMTVTDPKHIAKAGAGANRDFRVTEDRRPYETAPDGNQVILEEQMLRMNETQANHSAMTSLYKKHIAMFKSVIRSNGG
jgi:flagellar basal-body rod protein FlgB